MLLPGSYASLKTPAPMPPPPAILPACSLSNPKTPSGWALTPWDEDVCVLQIGGSLGLRLGLFRDAYVAQNGAQRGQPGCWLTGQLSNTLIKSKDVSRPTSHPPVCWPRWDCGYRDGGAGRVGSVARRWEGCKGPSSAVSPREENQKS